MFDWYKLLDPANGGPGQAPGYTEAVKAVTSRPPRKKKGKGKKR